MSEAIPPLYHQPEGFVKIDPVRGVMRSPYGWRMVLFSEDQVDSLQRSLEMMTGSGANIVLYRLGDNFGRKQFHDLDKVARTNPTIGGDAPQPLSGRALAFVMQAGIELTTLFGWGVFQLLGEVLGKETFVMSLFNSGYASVVGVKGQPACYLYAGYWAGYLSAYRQYRYSALETRCTSKGDEQCLFIIGPEQRINTARFLLKKGADISSIEQKLVNLGCGGWLRAARCYKYREVLMGIEGMKLEATPLDQQTLEMQEIYAEQSAERQRAWERIQQDTPGDMGVSPTRDIDVMEAGIRKRVRYDPDKFIRLNPEKGEVRSVNGWRQIIYPEDFIVAIQQSLESVTGEAAAIILYRFGEIFGYKQWAWSNQVSSAMFKGKTLRDFKFPFVMKLASETMAFSGWGNFELVKDLEEKQVFTIELGDSAYAGLVGILGVPACHIYAGYWAGYFSGFWRTRLGSIETKCLSMGDTYCRFVICSNDRINAARFWHNKGMKYEEIQDRLAYAKE